MFVALILLCMMNIFDQIERQNKKEFLSLAGIWNFELDPSVGGIESNGVQLLLLLLEEITFPTGNGSIW
ncbi:hypothetical protein [Anaerorudis cellulosivorans]|uniref:hypothetical protein n=1 Tax=Anaerorudis cellulosivorans TaxID=3397862 RepID=UPI00221EE06D|nr:hypothetical protein [Seramator thermalis]MCW1735155.1 hypothetical protein [Seramator thermalis]